MYRFRNHQVNKKREAKKSIKLKKNNITLLLFIAFAMISFYTLRSFSHESKVNEFQVKTYLVRSGDTLWDIAMKYKAPEEDPREYIHNLMQLNEMSSSSIYSGQNLEIKIPVE